MTKLNPNSARFISAALGLWFCLLAHHAGAVWATWDPQGTSTTANDVGGWWAGDLSGTWESSAWSTLQTQFAETPVPYVEGSAVIFAIGSGTGTPIFTVTMSANHTVAGIYDGTENPNPCPVVISGTGTMILQSGNANRFSLSCDYGSPSALTVNNVIAGDSTAPLYLEGNTNATGLISQIYLNGINTYAGTTVLGFSGAAFGTTVNFNNSSSFGTGSIVVSNTGSGLCEIAYEGSDAVTLPNPVVWPANTYVNGVDFVAGSGGPLTLSGNWSIINTAWIGASGTVIISGLMAGTGGLTCNGLTPGTLELTALNTFTGATTIANGTLQLGDGVANNSTVGGTITVTSPGSLTWANPTALTYAKVISGTGSVTYQGPGILTLSGAGTYTGGTTISAGTVKLGVANALPGASDLALAGTLDMGGFSSSVGAFNGAGTVTDSTGTGAYILTIGANGNGGTFSGTINNGVGGGTVGLTKNGGGAQYLSGVNTYSGLTTINAGYFALLANNVLPAGSSVVVNGGAQLDFVGFGDTIAALSVSGAQSGSAQVLDLSSTLTVSGNATPLNGQNFNGYSCISAPLNVSGTLVKGGTHAMAIRGNNASSGWTMTLNAGTLSVGAVPNALPTSTALNVPTGATFQLDANSQTVVSLTGSGNIDLGGGTLTIQGGSGGTFSGVIQNSDLPGSSTALGHGLRGYYYTNVDMTVLAAVRDDPTINILDVQTNLPASLLPYKTNQISVRWVGQVLTTAAGSYNFVPKSDDGQRLWVNGVLLVDNWATHGATAVIGTTPYLNANTRYDIVMEYFNNTDGGNSILSWNPPGDLNTNLIPTSNLFLPGAGSVVVGSGGREVFATASTYTGGTTVTNGGYLQAQVNGALGGGNVTVQDSATSTLELDNSGIIASTADLILDASTIAGTVYLNFTGTNTIHGVSFAGGAPYAAAGVYGHNGSALNPGGVFSGTGYLKVTASPTANTLAVSSTTPVYATPVTNTATVTGSAPTPTGTVTFWDGANWLGTNALVSGVATLVVSNLLVGVGHTITAVYSGDATHDASTSSSVSVSTSVATITPVPVVLKTYDGTYTVYYTNTTFILSGLYPGDANNVYIDPGSYSAAFTDSPNVGTGKPVSIYNLALDGSLAGNYQLNFTSPLNTTGTITNRVLYLSGLTTTNRVYNATTNENYSGTGVLVVTNVIAADAGNVTLVTTSPVLAFTNKTVATGKPIIIVSGYSLTGSAGGNYVVALTNLANITNFPITVAATVADVTYDGAVTNYTTLSGAALNPPAFPGDNVVLGGTPTAYFTNAIVGVWPVTLIGSYAITGSDAPNYAFSQPSLTGPITTAHTTAAIVSSFPSGVGAGTPVTFTVTVTSTTPTILPPTGSVNFYTNSTSYLYTTVTIASNTPTSSTNSFTTNALPVGTTKVVVKYLGDNNFSGTSLPLPSLNQVVTNALVTSRVLEVTNITYSAGTATITGTGVVGTATWFLKASSAINTHTPWTSINSGGPVPGNSVITVADPAAGSYSLRFYYLTNQ